MDINWVHSPLGSVPPTMPSPSLPICHCDLPSSGPSHQVIVDLGGSCLPQPRATSLHNRNIAIFPSSSISHPISLDALDLFTPPLPWSMIHQARSVAPASCRSGLLPPPHGTHGAPTWSAARPFPSPVLRRRRLSGGWGLDGGQGGGRMGCTAIFTACYYEGSPNSSYPSIPL